MGTRDSERALTSANGWGGARNQPDAASFGGRMGVRVRGRSTAGGKRIGHKRARGGFCGLFGLGSLVAGAGSVATRLTGRSGSSRRRERQWLEGASANGSAPCPGYLQWHASGPAPPPPEDHGIGASEAAAGTCSLALAPEGPQRADGGVLLACYRLEPAAWEEGRTDNPDAPPGVATQGRDAGLARDRIWGRLETDS